MPYLEFNDERERRWRVWDTYPRSYTSSDWPGYSGGWLTFECIECDPPEEKRRLAPVPDRWEVRDAFGLRQLLESAELIVQAPRTAPA